MAALPLPNFRGHEADEFTFYRIPKLLTTDERLRTISTDAKFLYGAMLDRMGLSIDPGWLDEKGDVYIYYTVEETMKVLNCKSEKATKVLAELDGRSGIGLIERVRQGQGKPTRIYLKNFAALRPP